MRQGLVVSFTEEVCVYVCVCVWGGSPFHEVDHIDDARRTDHGLISEDGPHGLFHTELGLQGRQERLNLLPECKKNKIIDQLFTALTFKRT